LSEVLTLLKTELLDATAEETSSYQVSIARAAELLRGGELVAIGTPEEVAAVATSYTGRFLEDLLTPVVRRTARKAAAIAA